MREKEPIILTKNQIELLGTYDPNSLTRAELDWIRDCIDATEAYYRNRSTVRQSTPSTFSIFGIVADLLGPVVSETPNETRIRVIGKPIVNLNRNRSRSNPISEGEYSEIE